MGDGMESKILYLKWYIKYLVWMENTHNLVIISVELGKTLIVKSKSI